VTDLRKLMLEELERRNYAASTTVAYCTRFRGSHATSIDLPINSGRITSASTRLTCSAKESSSRTRLPSILAEFGSSTSRLSDNPGARTRRITRGRCAILSREEVNSLIEAAPTPFQRTLLMALYATGTTSGKTDIQARGGPKAGSNSGA
jgi:integrase/recombinase XerD